MRRIRMQNSIILLGGRRIKRPDSLVGQERAGKSQPNYSMALNSTNSVCGIL